MQKVQKLKIPKGYSVAVLHTHSNFSDGMVTPTRIIIDAAQAGVRILALTDHDTLSGILEAKKAGKKFGVEIIVGEEVQTAFPRLLHIIGLFLKEKIPHNKSVLETIDRIHKQKGLAIIPHPFVSFLRIIPAPTASFQKKDLISLIKQTKVDGIEMGHRFLSKNTKEKLESFYKNNQKLLGAQIGVSDSHFGKDDLLSYFTIFPGKTASDLYLAIKNRRTVAVKGRSNHIPKKDLLLQNLKSLTLMSAKRYLPFIKY